MYPLVLVSNLILVSSMTPPSEYSHQPSMSSIPPQATHSDSLPDKKFPPVSLIKYFVGIFRSGCYTCSVIYLDEVGDIDISDDFMISCHDIHSTVQTTGRYK